MISNTRNLHLFQPIYGIPIVKEYNYLGCILDNKGNFKK